MAQAKFDSSFNLESSNIEAYNCQYDVEMHFNDTSKYQTFFQGEHIHSITSGAPGKPGYAICEDLTSAGRFKYAQNLYNGWVQVHADATGVELRYRGLDNETDELLELYHVRMEAKRNGST